jgi:GAG-pre-integrase domain
MCPKEVRAVSIIVDELIGSPVSYEDLVLHVLSGLGSDYNALVVSANSKENLSFAELQAMLMSHESLLQSQMGSTSSLPSLSPTAYFTAPKSGTKNNFYQRPPKSNFHYRPRPRSTGPSLLPTPHMNYSPRPFNRPNSSLSPRITSSGFRPMNPIQVFNPYRNVICQICEKRGHSAKKCWYMNDETYADISSQPSFQAHLAQPKLPQTVQPNFQANNAQPSYAPASPEWYLDSEASHHVTNDLNNLSSYLPYEGVDALHIGNSSGMHISHIGSSFLKFSNHTLLLHDVLYVPHFMKNLLSLSRLLIDNSIVMEFASNSCVLKERHTLKPLLHLTLLNGLYIFPPQITSPPHALFGEKVSTDLWHMRLGHPSSSTTHNMLLLHSLPCTSNKMTLYNDCCVAKSHIYILPFVPSTSTSSSPLAIVYLDVWGLAPLLSNNGFRYYIIFVDDYSRYTWIYFLRTKDEVVHVFSLFKAQVENLLNTTIKVLRMDGGIEYKPIQRMFPSITHQQTCPYTPQQNDISERRHRHIIELALSIMAHSSLPTCYWDDIFLSVIYLINRQPSSHNDSSPYFTLFQKLPDYSLLWVLGCLCFPYTRPYTDHKLQPRSLPCVFLGYSLDHKGYKCLHIESGKLFISHHVIFDELTFPFRAESSADSSTSAEPDHIPLFLSLLSPPSIHSPLLSPTGPGRISPSQPTYSSGSLSPSAATPAG